MLEYCEHFKSVVKCIECYSYGTMLRYGTKVFKCEYLTMQD